MNIIESILTRLARIEGKLRSMQIRSGPGVSVEKTPRGTKIRSAGAQAQPTRQTTTTNVPTWG